MKYNIFAGGIHIESSTFTPYRSSRKDFIITQGEDFLKRYPFIYKYKDRVNLIPVIHARAVPGGIVERGFYEDFVKEFIDKLDFYLKKFPIDGFLFDIHGAMSCEDSLDAEGDFLRIIKSKIGDSVPVSASMDLHGNVSENLFNLSAVLTCYRTAPHTDVLDTRERALNNLIRVLEAKKHGKKVVKAMVPVPVILSGEKTSTQAEPAKSLYKKIPELIHKYNALDASIFMGFPWADQPRSHAAVCAYGFDKISAAKCAEKLAQEFWGCKDSFKFVGPVSTLNDGLKKALASKEKPYFLSDTGDNPGAGGDGDTVIVLREILNFGAEKHKKIAFLSIKDDETVKFLLDKPLGFNYPVKLGGKINKNLGGPLCATMQLVNKYKDDAALDCAVLQKDGLKVVVTSGRYQFGTEEGFKKAGLGSYSDYDIIAVKMGYLEPDLSRAAKGWTMLLTEGSVNQDLSLLQYKKLSRPLYPLDKNFTPYLKPVIQEE